MTSVANYTKLIAAVVGLLLLWIQKRYGVDVTGLSRPVEEFIQATLEVAISGITAFAVFFFPNRKPKP